MVYAKLKQSFDESSGMPAVGQAESLLANAVVEVLSEPSRLRLCRKFTRRHSSSAQANKALVNDSEGEVTKSSLQLKLPVVSMTVKSSVKLIPTKDHSWRQKRKGTQVSQPAHVSITCGRYRDRQA
jgi:hypothetical protein